MTKERLQEIKGSIEFQMQIQQAVGFKSRYDDLLIEQIDLYNEVIDLQEKIDKAIEYIEYNDETLYTYEPDYDYEENIVSNYDVSSFREDLLEILKGDKE